MRGARVGIGSLLCMRYASPQEEECSYCLSVISITSTSLATLARNPFFIFSPHHTYHHHRPPVSRFLSIYRPFVLYNNSFLLSIRLSQPALFEILRSVKIWPSSFARLTHPLSQPTPSYLLHILVPFPTLTVINGNLVLWVLPDISLCLPLTGSLSRSL